MDKWLGAALDYIPRWLEHQMRISKQPGCVMAIAHNGKLVLERAYGFANLKRGVALTPRHRFRVASHSPLRTNSSKTDMTALSWRIAIIARMPSSLSVALASRSTVKVPSD